MCKFARARVLIMLHGRATWKHPNPSLWWCFHATTEKLEEAFGETEVPYARSAAIAPARFLLRNRPSMAGALEGPQEGRVARCPIAQCASAFDPKTYQRWVL